MEIILVGHAQTAKAFKEAVEMIYGEVPNFHPVDFTPKEGLQSLTSKIVSKIEPNKAAETLIITDLFSGTPYNASAELVLKKKAADVVAGMCLPMLLEVAVNSSSMSVSQLVAHLMKNKEEFSTSLSEKAKTDTEEDDF
ncbi:PTS sugar transporter subunit IIA [Lacticaseibacillus parahuelsenbergensis]|uniref:PTS sugar transporter subunit IIA n=1 Tax=Lacticaseibacillus parahuelsenbergensis TaxID=3068305 RepID=A0ABY9L7L6_9LACO|nr:MULTISPECIES: PTS sugar transporter subunit IIA [Lacticaseibacillus]MDE3281488.1 PTS sugar transporter subunit IIA [Lacticaseibacillus casei]WLV78406.1 PTS sugar transporter subunit IIA [Lacticaseibacillus sp. NCIMB 15471]